MDFRLICRKTLLAAIFAVASVFPVLAAEGTKHAPEPPGLWTGPMVSDTPATLQGAKVIDVPDLEKLMPQKPLLIDVGPADPKPDGLPSSTIWMPTHRSIPGAVWFPGAGSADLPTEKVEALFQRIAELTKGDKSVPVVTFCRPRCWASWNIGKRLVQAGYTSVHWLPAGVSGWQERNDTTAVDPEAGWIPKPPTGGQGASQ
ncbi:PQQ-dependent catabolism-associated CXXCW motif protein [Mesorhizobium sp. J18]|uniref:rhodanese-like domain-containing protein n=1 Tax=Mesorhizobium sp. J18 TaxID=935263 RepID=UPI00119A72A4|nr:rhodanese-like domain-containing protein [Mesorhizobium sp. J18]TWG97334.1 PQQ-dependent catabolism-associated CXXCW motif protein [Mesorhizobium sp. J18]